MILLLLLLVLLFGRLVAVELSVDRTLVVVVVVFVALMVGGGMGAKVIVVVGVVRGVGEVVVATGRRIIFVGATVGGSVCRTV